jgi:hypothetical protein
MPPDDADAEVGGKPTAAVGAGAAGSGAADEAVSGAVVLHHPVPGRSTAGWSYHILPLLCFLVGVDRLICDDDITDKLWE